MTERPLSTQLPQNQSSVTKDQNLIFIKPYSIMQIAGRPQFNYKTP